MVCVLNVYVHINVGLGTVKYIRLCVHQMSLCIQ